MRYVQTLIESEKLTLSEMMKNHSSARARMRAHGILLSHREFNVGQISVIYEVDRDTVSRWLDDWENKGIVGLYDEERSGRPKKLTDAEEEQIRMLAEKEPRSTKILRAQIKKRLKKDVSHSTIKRTLKKLGLVWKRVRKSLKSKRNEAEFLQIKSEISELRALEHMGKIDLYFFDGAGFSLVPSVPYAWQKVGERIEVLSSKSGYLNVLGFLSVTQNFKSFIFEDKIDAQTIIACFDNISEKLDKPTWIILDNAPQHRSRDFREQISKWEKRNLFLQYLPAYSPELNLIEILWRFIKYMWMPFSAYLNFESLQQSLEEILRNIGKKYLITFG